MNIISLGRITAKDLRGGMLVRKPAPYKGYNVCEWTRIARVERITDRGHGGAYVLYGVNGKPVDTFQHGDQVLPSSWSGNSVFELGRLADDAEDENARFAAIDPQIRGWHHPSDVADD